MPGSIGKYFGVRAIPIERQRKPFLKTDLWLPPAEAVELRGISELAVDFAVWNARPSNVRGLIELGDLAERLDYVKRSARHAATGIEGLSPSCPGVQ